MMHSSNLDSDVAGHGSGGLLCDFACPVCRAKQIPQLECRRCGADLALYIRALNSVVISRERLDLAIESGDSPLAVDLLNYIHWLVPEKAEPTVVVSAGKNVAADIAGPPNLA
jgi:hypothetical protein